MPKSFKSLIIPIPLKERNGSVEDQTTLQFSMQVFHTVNSGSEMVRAKHVSGKNIYWSTCIGKSKERKIFDFLHCPFEPPAIQHRPVSQLGSSQWQCTNSKIFPPLLLTVKVDQNIFFPETCFASTISEPEFTVWLDKQLSIWRIIQNQCPFFKIQFKQNVVR